MIKKFLIEIIVKFLLDGFQALYSAYVGKKHDEAANEKNREELENANTDEELQDAANGLAGRLGRNP